jgi:tRNA1(Val) A37 N6-methylase TrmN6
VITISQLVDELGYTRSPLWKVGMIGERPWINDPRVVGAYTFKTAPTSGCEDGLKTAVVVAEVKTEEEGRALRKKLWNFGNVAFVIILLPSQIRVYTGFSFSDEGKRDLLAKDDTLDIVQGVLSDFHSSEIDSGNIWRRYGKKLKIQNRVDSHLLLNLEKLDRYLVYEKQLDPKCTHAIIGKFIYFSYLRDRRILSDEWLSKHNIDANSVFGRTTTLSSFLSLSKLLDDRFEGTIFPFVPDNKLSDDIISLISAVFWGDEPLGQLSLDFSLYDFSYIPVELLSSIYEQFLHIEGKGDSVGAYYTPEPLAGYLISEICSFKSLTQQTKILDPCCGSGVFLVLVYRRLIELELVNKELTKLTPNDLRAILVNNIFGIERNIEACLVTQFSLILTLLSYLDPPDLHQNEDFKFPDLHSSNIINADFFESKVNFPFKFDWIIGNPPWFEVEDFDEEHNVVDWIKNNKLLSPVARNRVCEAFTWKVAECLSEDGYAGLVVHATSLTNKQSLKFRQAFFKKNTVVKITNFSNLAYILFEKRAEAPAATIIYRKGTQEDKPNVIHFAPFVYNQIPICSLSRKYSWVITVYDSDVQSIPYERIVKDHSNIWKLALWGNYRDYKNIGSSAKFMGR